MATVGHMMSMLMKGKAKPSHPVGQIVYTQFKKVGVILLWSYTSMIKTINQHLAKMLIFDETRSSTFSKMLDTLALS